MKIIVLNGPNLNMLGKRDTNHYGKLTPEVINSQIKSEFPDIEFEFFQSNIEGELINKIQVVNGNFDGLIINPGGYAHTSVAIRDALELVKTPKIEVHLSNISKRDNFRQTLLTAGICDGYISGFQELSYIAGVYLLTKILAKI
ncbi:3-dehydroquinate dehydratase [bacterium BMS3Abin04]|nr:3-dehydroquinate dehydratase [bacterium BMS3Abin04]